MAYMDVNLNVAAMAVVFGELNTKVRVRVKDGKTQVRPTTRVSGKLLPKGEQLRNVTRKGNAGRFGLPTAFTDGMTAGTVAFAEANHGWFTLVQGAEAAFAPAQYQGRVSTK